MTPALAARIGQITGLAVTGSTPLHGGCIGQVLLVSLQGGGRVVAKLGPGLEPEGWMLRTLASQTQLPVPHVVHADDDLLLLNYIEAGEAVGDSAQIHAAHLLAGLHELSWHSFGLSRDTVIGGLTQPNPPTPRWADFFRDHRLLYMADEAVKAGRLPPATRARIDRLAAKMDRWIDEPSAPALLHGDAWGGNILCRNGRVAAFIDPALYYGDPEIELAFGTLFGTFARPFFTAYDELRPISPAFWEVRRELYTLYPLLVHVRLFGGSYVSGVESALRRLLG